MSFIAQDFEKLTIIAVLEVEHKLSSEIFFDKSRSLSGENHYMDMFSPYYDLAKQIHFQFLGSGWNSLPDYFTPEY